jgi:uncharacterized protein YfbU (UPF0304 family)
VKTASKELRTKDMNSHGPSLDGYRRMLKAWQTSEDYWDLSKADLEWILAARTDPSRP